MINAEGQPADSDYGAGLDAILIASDYVPDRFAVALHALKGRLVARIDWQTPFDPDRSSHVVIVDTGGIGPALLVERLPLIVDHATAMAATLIVAMDFGQIDTVAAATLGGGTILLVDPGPADCAAAIVVAGERARVPTGVFDVARETDGARLERLSNDVARIAETLARLTRAERDGEAPVTPIVGDRTTRFGAVPSAVVPSATDVRRMIRARRLRDQFFGAALFEDPGWDMLLDLYAAELERTRVSVSSLCIAAAVAPTTALRWIARMTDIGLFERHPDLHDRRRAFMVLSTRASEAMRGYMVEIGRADRRIS